MAYPRVVIVTRPTEWEELLARHATAGQARFFLETRGRAVEPILAAHAARDAAVVEVERAIPAKGRRMRVSRAELDRFLFEPEDVVVVVGQDGLVPNVAKYLDGQLVLGVNPSPERFDGVLVQHSAAVVADFLLDATRGTWPVEERTMVEACLDDGQRLVALNELFVGHRSHQSARYTIEVYGRSEAHSSSGIVVATGTGATGWARSIARERADDLELPHPCERELVWFVREAFPSVATGTDLTLGFLQEEEGLEIVSAFERDGVVFGDGIEADHLDFPFGQRLEIGVATQVLRLATARQRLAAARQ